MIPFDLALNELKKFSNPEQRICETSAYWQPLQLVYVKLVENKDLTALSDLPKDERQRYWNLVKELEAEQWKKISIAQALYAYEVIK